MTDLKKLRENERLRRSLRRWVAAIRESILKKIVRDQMTSMAVLEADLRQCERLLLNLTTDIEHDPVLEIWLKESMRHGILWHTFAPKPLCFDCRRCVANGFSGRCLACTLKHQAACEHEHWDGGLNSCLDCGVGKDGR